MKQAENFIGRNRPLTGPPTKDGTVASSGPKPLFFTNSLTALESNGSRKPGSDP
jgi:hypothetical protein